MPFEDFTSPKTLSKNTVKIYKNRLNKLADAGVDTVELLVAESQYVIEFLDMVVEGKETDDKKREQRVWYSAIFWALSNLPNEKKTIYYDAFQKLKVPYEKKEPSQ